jgi:hypothetical protein
MNYSISWKLCIIHKIENEMRWALVKKEQSWYNINTPEYR